MPPRRSQATVLSLFAFQDIITGVSGVMLFILMLLVVQLVLQTTRNSQAKESQSTQITDESVNQAEVEELFTLLTRKQESYQSNKSRLELLLQSQSSDFKTTREQQKSCLEVLQAKSMNLQEQYKRLLELNRKSAEQNPSQSILEEIDRLNAMLREAEEELLEWKDSTRVNYSTTTVVPNLYLFDVHQREVRMMNLPIDDRQQVIRVRGSDTGESIAKSIGEQYTRLSKDRQDPQKRIVLLIRPSASTFADELITQLKNQGFEVALELLEAKAELFRKRRSSGSLGGKL